MDRILRDAGGGEVQLLNYDSAGALADIDGVNPPTVAVTDSGGNVVTGFVPSRVVAGTYKVILPSNLEQLDVFDVAWSWANGQSRASQFETVGSFLFTIAELRDYDSELTDTAVYTAAKIRSVRDEIAERFERAVDASFILRGRREYLSGDGTSRLLLGVLDVRRLVSAKVDSTALTSTELADVKVHPFGMLERKSATWTSGIRNVEVLLEYGLATVPEPVHRAAMRYAKYLLLGTKSLEGKSERATAVFNEMGGYRLTLAGRDGPTGLPEVDAVLAQFGHGRHAGGFA